MSLGSLENLGGSLPSAARLGQVADLRLERVTSEEEAASCPGRGGRGIGSSVRGYRVVASSALAHGSSAARRRSGRPLLAAEILGNGGTSFGLPAGRDRRRLASSPSSSRDPIL